MSIGKRDADWGLTKDKLTREVRELEALWRESKEDQNLTIRTSTDREVQDPDDVDSAREGYLLLFPVFANQLDRRIFYTVVVTDLVDTTPEREERTITNRIARAQAKAKDTFGDMVGYEAVQAYNYMNRVRTVSEKHAHTAPPGGMSIMGDGY